MPIGSEENFKGIVDLITKKARVYTDDLGTHSETTDIPEDMIEIVEEYREKMLEAIADHDEN